MPNSLKITFDNDLDGTFIESQQISGLVELQVDETVNKAKGLRLIIEGVAFTEWGVKSYGPEPRVAHVKGYQTFNIFETYLLGSKEHTENIEIPVGVHVYSFSCQLPADLPSSVEHELGHIRYKAKVNLELPWVSDLKSSTPFKLIQKVDLNNFPELRLPIEREEVKTFCCLFCKSNPLILRLRLPKSGFELGEKIPVNVEIINGSRTEVFFTNLSLIQANTFYAQARTKIQKDELLTIRCKGVDAGETISFDEMVEIPSNIVVSNSRYCKTFQISYEVQFFAETEGVSVSPTLSIPIVIGSVALRE